MSQNLQSCGSPKELELKISVPLQELRRLESAIFPSVRECSAPTLQRLETVYFDTAGQILRAHDISFRIRKEGKSFRQTAKAGTKISAGLSNPVEAECQISSMVPEIDAIPDDRLRRQIKKLLRQSALQPIFGLCVDRMTRLLTTKDGSQIELAADRANLSAAGRKNEFSEVELELKSGQASALYDVASDIADLTPVQLSTTSKAGRGYNLLAGKETRPLRPKKPGRSRIKKKQSIVEAFRAVCTAEIAPILHNWQVVLESDALEGPHQFRIALRRLRAALRAFSIVIDSDELGLEERELKEIGRVVGGLRDCDVLLADIVAPVQRPTSLSAGFQELEATLTSSLAKQRGLAREELTSRRWTKLMLKLALLSHGSTWNAPKIEKRLSRRRIEPLAKKAIDKCWKRALKLGQRIDELSVPERHSLRKNLKVLRYTVQIFEPIFSKKVCRSYLKKLSALQDIFGYLNDAALAEHLLEIETHSTYDEKALNHAIGFVAGYHECISQSTWHTAQRRWEELLSAKQPWR